MEARGYGEGKRTSFAIYRFQRRDGAVTAFIAVLSGWIFYGIFRGWADFRYYPTFSVAHDAASMFIYIAYALLVALPSVIEAGEMMRWKYLKSKI